ncbi:amino acid adenylation domain-containing protein [Agriterribacter sp.]|uniref:non-ribosomal peptide synthetase n=1 Tax=Agriterribacter sp. TaxID=2821509 RepID=UPI002C113679|nr:amino acid adenylation domain-containing protein [Agriterribacter sp.]HRP55245.1 amino acid adenylation domain-containing protein [Agriterribacter sp.]
MVEVSTHIPDHTLADTAPLSFAQQRMWFLHQLKPDSSLYNVFHTIHFLSPVNIQVLKQSLEKIISRHEILRTGFIVMNSQPLQKVRQSTDIFLKEINLSSYADPKNELKIIAAAEALKPFDLANDQLIRTTLVHVQPHESYLLVCMHHIITDAWSMGIFNRELKLFYEAALNGISPSPAPVKMQYRDYAAWENCWLNTDEQKLQLAFWENELANLPVLQLPVSGQSSGNHLFHGQSRHFNIPFPVFSRLKKWSASEEQTMFITMLAAFNVLLFRYSGQSDIVVGCPVSGRNKIEWEDMLGFFVNTVALRSRFSGDESFLTVSRRIKQVAFNAFEHQDIPFEMIVESLNPSRDASKNPLFQVVFQLQSTDEETTAGQPEETDLPNVHVTTSKFDLMLSITQSAHGLAGYFEYNSDRFPGRAINDLIRHFLQLLTQIAGEPQTLVAELSLLDTKEKALVKQTGSGSATAWPEDIFIHDLIAERALMNPGKTAVFSEVHSLTYGQLEVQSNQLANLLITKCSGPEPVVAVCMNRSVQMIVCHLAILKAGGAFVPLDAGYPEERLLFMLNDLQPDLVITESGCMSKLPPEGYPVFVTDQNWHLLENHPDIAPTVSIGPGQRAYIMFTSGSTGKPKGVELIHRGFTNLTRWNIEAYAIHENDRCLQMATPAYDAYIFELFPCLATGATAYLVDDITRTSAALLRKEIIEKKISITFLSTAIGQQVMAEPWPPGTSLRILAVGGEKLVKLPIVAPPFQLLNFYGPTENSVMTTSHPVVIDNKGSCPPIGKPISNVQLYVLDAFLDLVPVGLTGELYLGGKGVARGYFHRPALTAEKFVPDPFGEEPGSRLYRTGDLVRFLADGNLEFIGRVDHQVKLRGFRIELEEIEKLLHQHPAVKEAVVVMRENEKGDQTVTAYAAGVSGMYITVKALKDWLKQKLPDFMIPSAIVILDDLAKSFNGKIDRKALPEPDFCTGSFEAVSEEAQTETEMIITDIWKQYLPFEKVSVDANFFDMGGHSLMMAQVHYRLKETLQTDVPLITLFQYPTIRSLAKHLERMPATTSSSKIDDRAAKQRQAFFQQKRNRKPV